MLNVLDLFSGIGGFSLGLERTGYFKTLAFCESDDYCQQILKRHWPQVPIYGDITTLSAEQLRADEIHPDIITAGFPCQPFSQAGQRRGSGDDRFLWPTLLRIITEVRPTWLLLENVAGFLSLVEFKAVLEVDAKGVPIEAAGELANRMGQGFAEQAMEALEQVGYEVEAIVLPAVAVDAPHRRDRVWIVAHYEGVEWDVRGVAQPGSDHSLCQGGEFPTGRRGGIVADATGQGCDTTRGSGKAVFGPEAQQRFTGCDSPLSDTHKQQAEWAAESWSERCEWEPEPGVGRVAYGVPSRVDRLRALGNAVVPQVVEQLGRAIALSEDITHG